MALAIKQIGADLVVITSPFALIRNYWDSHSGVAKIDSGLYFTGSDFTQDIRTVAEATGVSIIVTHPSAFYDWRFTKRIVPWISESARAICKYRIYVSKPEKSFELEVVDTMIIQVGQSSKRISPPRMKRTPNLFVLKRICTNLLNNAGLTTLPLQTPALIVKAIPTAIWKQTYRSTIEERLEITPERVETFYGMVILIWRFNQRVKDVHTYLRSDATIRDLDLVRWSDHTYNIFNSKIDLHHLKSLGGQEKGTGLYKGAGMRFVPGDHGVKSFTTFLKYLTETFVAFEQLDQYLKNERGIIRAREEKQSKEVLKLNVSEYMDKLPTFIEDILPIFYLFPPTEPWAVMAERWETFLQKLRGYFEWAAIQDITNTIIANFDAEMIMEYSAIETREAIRDGLRKGRRYLPS